MLIYPDASYLDIAEPLDQNYLSDKVRAVHEEAVSLIRRLQVLLRMSFMSKLAWKKYSLQLKEPQQSRMKSMTHFAVSKCSVIFVNNEGQELNDK